MRGFRSTYTIVLDDDLEALCFHGSPRSFSDAISTAASDAQLDPMLRGFDAELLIGGHTHLQLVRQYRGSIFMNPGSLGLPFQNVPVGKPIRISPWAEYAVVSVEQGRLGVELRRTSYDVEGYLRSALSTGMPHAEWWVECWATGFARGAPSGAPEWA